MGFEPWRYLVLALLTAVLVGGAGPAGAGGPADDRQAATGSAVVAHRGAGGRVHVLDAAGRRLTSFTDLQFFSLDGGVLAGSRHHADGKGERIVGYDSATGRRRFVIENGFGPVVTAGGHKVFFAPDRWGRRDRYATSLWVRDSRGRERRVFQLTGPRATVPRDPFRGDGGPVDWAVDRAGHTLAVTVGNDASLFKYDVYVVDVRTRRARRITTGMVSRYPSVSPSGTRVALVREAAQCGGPPPGYRASKLQIVSRDGQQRRTLLDGSCAGYYTDPRWLSEDTLAAVRMTRVGRGRYATQLVRVDVRTGEVRDIDVGGQVGAMTVAARSGLIAFQHRDAERGFGVYDVSRGVVTTFDGGWLPQLAGEHRLR